MERLPYIDEHSTTIGATREQAWSALAGVLRAQLRGRAVAVVTSLLGVVPSQHHGALEPGDSLPGFAVAEGTRVPERLALTGRHRFSHYALVFELDAGEDPAHCTLRARTWAEFPGPLGRAYRALVIGSGGHRLVVRRLLREVGRHV